MVHGKDFQGKKPTLHEGFTHFSAGGRPGLELFPADK